ncbi:hypothetical protein NQ317_019365 [Molorchus minor]|uniref:Uncharacterized protein n=1 Tax=Molorchus minor TaxID=1323400 RepID=A0ABQ9JAE2_9CUCU|nr:hypothetical protein NQ317_019365 [Molorchus minor]
MYKASTITRVIRKDIRGITGLSRIILGYRFLLVRNNYCVKGGLYGYVLQPNFSTTRTPATFQSLMFTFGIEVVQCSSECTAMIKFINVQRLCVNIGLKDRLTGWPVTPQTNTIT